MAYVHNFYENILKNNNFILPNMLTDSCRFTSRTYMNTIYSKQLKSDLKKKAKYTKILIGACI
jgi:hypothetical protein